MNMGTLKNREQAVTGAMYIAKCFHLKRKDWRYLNCKYAVRTL